MIFGSEVDALGIHADLGQKDSPAQQQYLYVTR